MFGCLANFVLGLIAGLKENIRRVLKPMRWLLMSVLPVVLVAVCMIWFGMGSAQTIFATSLLILTIMYVNTITGIESVDSQILEMDGESIELESVDDDAKARVEELLKRKVL